MIVLQIGKVLTQCPHNYTGSYPYETDCHLFYDCWKGRGVVQTCPPGTAFHPTNLECDYVRKVAECFVDVVSTREQSCVMGDDKLLPVDDDCSKFVRCANGNEYLFVSCFKLLLKNNPSYLTTLSEN